MVSTSTPQSLLALKMMVFNPGVKTSDAVTASLPLLNILETPFNFKLMFCPLAPSTMALKGKFAFVTVDPLGTDEFN